MKNFIRIAALCLMFLPSVVYAQDLDKGHDAYISGDYATSFKEFKPLAERGNAKAQNMIGVIYQYGSGVPQDYVEAYRWYKKAAEQGYAVAQYNLGFMYSNGQVVPQDYITAHMWYNLAAASGHDMSAQNRDLVAGKMSQADVLEAQRRARVCMSSGYKDCE